MICASIMDVNVKGDLFFCMQELILHVCSAAICADQHILNRGRLHFNISEHETSGHF